MMQKMWLAVNIMWLPFNIRFDYTSTIVKFNHWDGGYDHILQPLQWAVGEFVVTPLPLLDIDHSANLHARLRAW